MIKPLILSALLFFSFVVYSSPQESLPVSSTTLKKKEKKKSLVIKQLQIIKIIAEGKPVQTNNSSTN